LTKHKNSFRI